MHLDGSRFLSGIYQALNLNRNEYVEVLSRIRQWQKSVSMDRESIEQIECTEKWLNGSKKLSKMCREKTQKS